jgi:uncharacterized protein YbaA (DUF1428 family)
MVNPSIQLFKSKENNMAGYVDGFVVPVPKKNVKAYLAMAKKIDKLWIKCGALSVMECVADDVKPGKMTSFPQSVKLKKDEVVVFSYVTFKSRKHRDAVNKKLMHDPAMIKMMDEDDMPFDGMRMIWGGFKPILKL